MKRIDNGQERKVPYCRAYKEDLQQVIDLMTVNNEPPDLASGDFEFADANELFTFLGETGKNEIKIRLRNPSVTMSASRYSDYVSVQTYDSSDASVALIHHVGEALSQCEGRKPVRATLWYFMTGNVLFWVSLNLIWYFRKERFALLFIGFAVTGLIIATLGITYRRGKANTFHGVSRDSRKSFLQRKGDDLVVSLISGLAGALLGALLGVAGTLFVQTQTATGPQNPGVHSSPTTSAARPNSD